MEDYNYRILRIPSVGKVIRGFQGQISRSRRLLPCQQRVTEETAEMEGLTSFKNEIFKYGIAAAAVMELASLPFLGLDAQFLYGLLLGTAIAIVNFNLMAFSFWLALEWRKGAIAFLGFLVRLAVYGAAFYMSVKIGLISGAGTALGFLTLKLALFYLHGFRPKYSKGRIVREDPDDLKPKKPWYDFIEHDD